MTFRPDESAGARITSLAEYNKCLDYLQGQGYNEIDTARVYNVDKQKLSSPSRAGKNAGSNSRRNDIRMNSGRINQSFCPSN